MLGHDLVFQPSYLLLVVGFPLLIALEAPLVVRAQPLEVLPRGLLRRELAPLLPQGFGLASQARPLGGPRVPGAWPAWLAAWAFWDGCDPAGCPLLQRATAISRSLAASSDSWCLDGCRDGVRAVPSLGC